MALADTVTSVASKVPVASYSLSLPEQAVKGSSKPRMGTSDRSLFMGSLSLLGDIVWARGAREGST